MNSNETALPTEGRRDIYFYASLTVFQVGLPFVLPNLVATPLLAPFFRVLEWGSDGARWGLEWGSFCTAKRPFPSAGGLLQLPRLHQAQ